MITVDIKYSLVCLRFVTWTWSGSSVAFGSTDLQYS